MLRSTIMAHMSEALAESKFRFKQLQEIETEVLWDEVVELVKPHFMSSSIGQNLISLETMMRIYYLQYRYGMSPSGVEEALFQIAVLRDFALIDIDENVIPSELCIERFNQLIRTKELKARIVKSFDLEPVVSC